MIMTVDGGAMTLTVKFASAVAVPRPAGVKPTFAPSTFAESVTMPPKLLVAVNAKGTIVAGVPKRWE